VQIKIRVEAERDLGDAAIYYNSRSDGVGDNYLECMMGELNALLNTAGTHREMHGCFRKLIKRFPYAVYYLVHDDTVDVVAVLHQRRGHQYIRQRLTEH
jgi:plasmid stabilization system protein ParE